jgi:UDP-glucose 4-epimerase
MKPAVLVTGADGFIGSQLVAALKSRGYAVRSHTLNDGDIAAVEVPCEGVRHVFHLAARSFVPDSWVDPRDFYRVNVVGTVNVLESCRRSGASLTYVSSYVYGRPSVQLLAEDHTTEALNPYGHSKLLAEEACGFYARRHGMRISIVRPFNIYGFGQDPRFLIPTLVRQVLSADSDVIEVADDRPRRDFLYVTDLVGLLIATFERHGAGVYHAGSGFSVSIADLVAALNRLAGCAKTVVSRGESRPHEILDVVADIGKARRELLWAPEVGLEEGLRITLEATARRGS